MDKSRRVFKTYTNIISIVGVVLFLGCAYNLAQTWEWSRLGHLALFSFLILVAEFTSVKMPGSDIQVTISLPLEISLLIIYGPSAAVVFMTVPAIIGCLVSQRHRPFRYVFSFTLFNVSNGIIALCLAATVYRFLGGEIPAGITGQLELSDLLLIAACVAVDILAVSICLAIGTGYYSRDNWQIAFLRNLHWSSPDFIFTVPVTILFVGLYHQYGLVGIIPLIMACAAARHACEIYARQISVYRDTIVTLGAYMQHHHAYTRGHLERVADLAYKLAMELNVPTRSLSLIREAGLLHDIGKVGVDDSILDKTGKLTDEEWTDIRRHPARGAEILARLTFLKRIVPWVRGHHERPDGKGYPDGLHADQIPVEAAVIAVADAFDAMTGGTEKADQRVYRKPLTRDQAVEQIMLGAGTQFDEQVVEAFIHLMSTDEDEVTLLAAA